MNFAPEFPVIVVTEAHYELSKNEMMGSKYKFWFQHQELGRCLYKQARQNLGEDWATSGETVHLAPTYDHASSLGRDLSDEQRQKRSSEAYANKCFSAFYSSVDDKKPLKTFDLFYQVAHAYPQAAHIWLERLESVSKANILTIFSRIPNAHISSIAAEFAQKILEFNQYRLFTLRESLP
ncbi:hypothetical protein [Chlorogloeopsis sp. ULAP02]|uniref:hypothetical protein n=1 Tax=Chlorogloeopsis sp. ULAP02 TaxID=3107926 RepID=UPI003135F310